MASVKAYIQSMRQAQNAIARKLGCDIASADKQTRVAVLACDAMLAVVLRVLVVDKALLSDAELQAALDAAIADLYDDEPVEPPPAP